MRGKGDLSVPRRVLPAAYIRLMTLSPDTPTEDALSPSILDWEVTLCAYRPRGMCHLGSLARWTTAVEAGFPDSRWESISLTRVVGPDKPIGQSKSKVLDRLLANTHVGQWLVVLPQNECIDH